MSLVTYAAPFATILIATSSWAATLEPIYSFGRGVEGYLPGDVYADSAGNLYMDTEEGGAQGAGATIRYSPSGGRIKVLYVRPNAIGAPGILTVDESGNCYGFFGASNLSIFKLTKDGRFSTLYSFDFVPFTNGLVPEAHGYLLGFVSQDQNQTTVGEVFRLSPTGKFAVLYSQQAFAPSSITKDSAGNIFGTDIYKNTGEGYGGNVFKISSGALSVVYAFKGYPSDGAAPYSVQIDNKDNLIGATAQGGRGQRQYFGNGTAYKVSLGGEELFDVSFGNGDVGRAPSGPFYPDGKGNYIGVTAEGTKGAKYGTVFQLSAEGKLSPLHIFSGGTDGRYPNPRLVPDGHGSFYGTAGYGGAYNKGLIFKFTP